MGNLGASCPPPPLIVSIGEPLIEFNRPKEGDGRTWLQGFGGDSQNVAIAAVRQGASAGYLTSLGQDWMGDAFLELWKSEGLDASRVTPPSDRADRRQLRHPRPGRPQVRLPAQELRRLADDARDVPADYIAGARYFHLSAIGQAISDSARATCDAAISAARAAGVKVSYDTNLRLRLWDLETARRDHRRHHRALRRRCCRASTIPSSSPGSRGAGRDRRSLSQARRAAGGAEDVRPRAA